MNRPTTYKPLPPDLWGVHEEKKKQGCVGESAWYVTILEDISTAAWWLVRDPSPAHLETLKATLKKWDKVLGL